jgi:hypothetical protein
MRLFEKSSPCLGDYGLMPLFIELLQVSQNTHEETD